MLYNFSVLYQFNHKVQIVMLKYLKIIASYLSSQELLVLTEIFSFSFKLYLLIIIINHLISILLASMMYFDVSNVPYHFYKIYLPNLDNRIIAFMARLGWISKCNIVFYLSCNF